MTAEVCTTARPPKAAIAWATRDALFVEIPHKSGGAPYICRYRLTVEHLQQALNILIDNPDVAPTRSMSRDHPAVKYVGVPKPTFTDAQREAARGALASVIGGLKTKPKVR